MRYIIIGSGIAGISAAKAIREHDQKGEIMVCTHEFHPLGLYARKDMARRLAAGINTPDELLIEDQTMLERQGIQLLYHEALRVFPHLHQVLRAHHLRWNYDRLLIATGATPRLVDAPGLHYIGVHQVRNYQDFALIESWMPELQQKGAVIIGGGILGLDMAHALTKRGIPTTLVVREDFLGAPRLPKAASRLIERRARLDGINIIFNQTLTAYLSDDERTLDAVRLSDQQIIPARMALCTIGIRANTYFLEGSGIEIDEKSGAIPVNAHMETNAPDIYAAGNCALVKGSASFNWTQSAEQGRVAGLNMTGLSTAYEPSVPGDLDTQIYDLPLAYFGRNTPATSAAEVWTWDDGDSQFAQIMIEDGHIVGTVLIGEIASVGAALHERYRARVFTQVSDLEGMLSLAQM